MMITHNLRRLLGLGLLFGAGLAVQAQNPVTVSVDMNSQLPTATDVFLKGSFDGWGAGQQLTNDGSGVFTGTVNIASSPGTVIACKFMYNPGGVWESFSPDRQFIVAGGAQTLPLTTWNTSDWPVPTQNVTFQVDLSRYTNSAGQQAATLVDVRGAFNNWSAGSTLLNNGANVYTNTFSITSFKSQYKFTYTTPVGVTWEDDNPPPGAGQPPDEGNNRVLVLNGTDQTLPVVPFYAPSVTPPINLPTNYITYRVDMTEQVRMGNFIPDSGFDTITVAGAPAILGSWNTAGYTLTNDPSLSGDASNIYSAVIEILGIPGAKGGEFKFRMNGGWEETAIGDNRNFTIAGGAQVLPVYYYWDQPLGDATNANVTFQVDMTPQVVSGGFTNGVSTVTVSGYFTGWGNGTAMANNPSLPGTASNVYSVTIAIANPPGTPPTTTVGLANRYKFRANSGWESAAIYGVGQNKDRQLIIAGGDQVLPLVTYNDASLCDVLLQQTAVTFVTHLPNGRLDNNGVPFDKVNDKVYLNGDFLSWPTWNNSLPQMTNNPVGSDYYEVTLSIPPGTRRMQYKFGLDGPGHGFMDNENPVYSDHVKYVRNNNAAYTLPVTEFGNLYLSTLVEPSFGNLAAGAPSGGNVPISWLGGPCVTLQSRPSLSAGPWTDHPSTDATGSTNWPATGDQQFFRLQKRPLP